MSEASEVCRNPETLLQLDHSKPLPLLGGATCKEAESEKCYLWFLRRGVNLLGRYICFLGSYLELRIIEMVHPNKRTINFLTCVADGWKQIVMYISSDINL